jgi:hypothetical protein
VEQPLPPTRDDSEKSKFPKFVPTMVTEFPDVVGPFAPRAAVRCGAS